ncbi:MAG: hypothetical protein PHQ50_01515 [Eubacteriales bacterium]|nr:hypothetical protein [Eubacteriales bacterium]
MKKKMFVLCLAMLIALNLPATVFASDAQKSQEEYYQIKGQIDFEGVTTQINGDRLVVSGAEESDAKFISSEIGKSKELGDMIRSSIQNGETPVAIGYTIVELKTVEDENGNWHFQPFTVAEKQQALRGTGNTVSKGNLRLYTYAATISGGVIAKSTASWTTDYTLDFSKRPANGDDFISITAPSAYNYQSDSFWAKLLNTNTYLPNQYFSRNDQDYTSVVYQFTEYRENVFQVSKAQLQMNCTGTVSGSKTFISKYVHTWQTAVPSISIGLSGVTFGLGGMSDRAWQVASNVVI